MLCISIGTSLTKKRGLRSYVLLPLFQQVVLNIQVVKLSSAQIIKTKHLLKSQICDTAMKWGCGNASDFFEVVVSFASWKEN